MEHCAHHVVIVTGENADAGARLPVPDANRLIVGCAKNPGIFVVENCGTNVVQVTQKGENASLLLVIPDLKKKFCNLNNIPQHPTHFYLEIVTTRHKQGLLAMEADTSDGSIVLIELLKQCADTIVPQLNHSSVQTKRNFSDFLQKHDDKFFIFFYLARIHGRFGWKQRPLTRADFVSKLVNIAVRTLSISLWFIVALLNLIKGKNYRRLFFDDDDNRSFVPSWYWALAKQYVS